MPDIPNWLTAVISSVIAAVFGWIARDRHLSRASVAEKDASTAEKNALTAKIYAEVAEDAVKQLKQVREEIPGWMQKLAAETARADAAEKRCADACAIQEQARIIVEEANHFSFMKVIDEPVSEAEIRFLNIKQAAIAIGKIGEEQL